MMIPGFHTERDGYNKREVDDYIDYLLIENKKISHENIELSQMWLTKLDQLEKQYLHCREQGFKEENIAWGRLSTLLEKSQHRQRQALATTQPLAKTSILGQESELTHGTEQGSKKPGKIKAICFNLVFYLTLVVIVLGVFLFMGTNTAGPPKDIAGFSAMMVLTRSMQNTIPQNALIVTKQVDPTTIRIGDDITYLMSNNTTVTHRVIHIQNNYAGTGQPGFETQGTMNEKPDAEIVIASNVVGRVIFQSLALGRGILYIRAHIMWVGIFTGLIIALSIALRVVFSKKHIEKLA